MTFNPFETKKNPDVFVEKYVENPKHVEIQILGDKHGNVIHLGERNNQEGKQSKIGRASCRERVSSPV